MEDSFFTYEEIQNKKIKDLKEIINYDSELVINEINFSKNFNIILGPCAIESSEQINQVISFLKEHSLKLMRGGIVKLRTSPYSFSGIGSKAYELVKEIKRNNITFISEITSVKDIKKYEDVDILMIGARNMQNIELLKKCAETNKPIILKRAPGATLYEFLASAEFIISSGNNRVILCERGIRTFDTYNRYTIDLGGAIYLKSITKIPIIIDPSHAMGRRELILPLARATKAAGLNGLLIEMHPNPIEAKSDARQQIDFKIAERILLDCEKINFL